MHGINDKLYAALERFFDEARSAHPRWSTEELIARNVRTIKPFFGPMKEQANRYHYTPTQEASHFDVFWEIYPRKAGKQYARRAFHLALVDVGHEVVLDGARRYAADPYRERRMKYIPHPSTWLNGHHFDDPPAEFDSPQRPIGFNNEQHWKSGGGFGMPGQLSEIPEGTPTHG